ncbi:hypothetical protein [Nostoc sp. TCL26-01]|uniref:hypothetical protein n=1 Tax=Nostoc sp. TCL26-01 TaxID=2576904 RepID=UPI0015B87DD0|nr:hypothetical protein [Nostoc sp. TCL26-01]QLE55448.1 hypothetical protein FD725_07915 [Nostoc sp. TCL26-01]
MTVLTEHDQKNYAKLKEAVGKIKANQDKSLTDIKELVAKSVVENTEQLSKVIVPLDSYWKFLSAFGKSIEFTESQEQEKKFEQQFSDAIAYLKRLLQIVEADKVDLTSEIEKFQPDSLFLNFIKNIPPNVPNPQTWTKILIENRQLNITEEQINQLIQAWGTAVSSFVEDARTRNEKKDGKDGKVTPLQPETFAHFFRIQKELEILYGRLADSSNAQSFR